MIWQEKSNNHLIIRLFIKDMKVRIIFVTVLKKRKI